MPNTLHITFLIPPLNYSGWACFLNPFIPRTFLQFNIWLKRFFISYLTLIQIYPFCWYNTCKKICKTMFILLIIVTWLLTCKRFLNSELKLCLYYFIIHVKQIYLFQSSFGRKNVFLPPMCLLFWKNCMRPLLQESGAREATHLEHQVAAACLARGVAIQLHLHWGIQVRLYNY